MKPRYFGWRPLGSTAKKFATSGIPCMCPGCLKANPARAEMFARLKAEVRAGLNGQRLTEVES